MKGIAPDEIGVVVPYRAQSRLIRSLFRQIIGEEEIVKKLVVDTVERMQGQEREVVMLSFTTSNPFFAAQVADFLLQPQRLNVAVTRPRTKLILLGSYRLLDVEQVDPAYQEAVKLLRSLLASCRTIVLPSGYLV
jgi:DNA replication ATP-dependent helicase Dna2